ncbi:MAG: ABC transporter ATP-binding protein [Nitrososphaerota archaeon]|nr:ABC transporter ATP-binding protein [Candidatus Bathyarchaeota archaeon]MDW8048151.1 ABC transporter ATP-binding protein [Nitrososphaerota archaeon]
MNSVVVVRNIRKIYDVGETKVIALDGVSLEVERGEYVAVLGPSGSGKSTLLNLLGGLDRPSSGSILIDGEDLGKLKESRLSRLRAEKIGFIFQFFNLIPTFSVIENVMVPAEILGLEKSESMRRAECLLEKVGLRKRARHFPHQLSGGEQQRVAIARALVNNPVLLLCDEPTGNLDTKTGAEIVNLLSEVNKEQNTTLIVVTHDKRIASSADRIVELVDGRIVREA